MQNIIKAIIVGLFGLSSSVHVWASGEPIQMLVGFPPGGGIDSTARIVALGMSDVLKQPVIVVNKPGAGGLLAVNSLKAAPPDGRTIMLTNDHIVAVLPLTLKNAGFDTRRDFRPIGLVTSQNALALVTHPKTGVKNLEQLREWTLSNQGRMNIGVPVPGSTPEFAAQVLSKQMKLNAQVIPYKGSGQMLNELLAFQIPVAVAGTKELSPFYKSKGLNVLAVTGSERSYIMPDVPTFSELGIPGFELSNLVGVYTGKGVTDAAAKRLTQALQQALEMPQIKSQMAEMGSPVMFGQPEELADRVQQLSTRWGQYIRESGYQPQ